MPDKTALLSVWKIDSGKDMENYESVGVEQIELDIVENLMPWQHKASKGNNKK